MEIVNQKNIKKFIVIVIIITVTITLVPLLVYYINFKNYEISKQPSDWGIFGSYFGGVIGTFFNMIGASFMLVSIYITLKIATKIQESENKFNENRIIIEKSRFEKEIELIHKQNKPFPYMDLMNTIEETSITLSNYGTGPLLVKEIRVLYNKEEVYPHIAALIRKKIKTKPEGTVFNYNSAPVHIIPPGKSKQLAIIKPDKEVNFEFKQYQSACKDYFKDCIIYIKYEDIFDSKSEMQFNLEFLHN